MRVVDAMWGSSGRRVLSTFAGLAILGGFFWALRLALLGPTEYMPHIHCYLYEPSLIWTHVSSDVLIGIAYASISMTLTYLVLKARVPFHTAFIAFGVFIGACGLTHFMEVWNVWEPHYWMAAWIKILTAAASMATAVWLFPLLPQAFRLVYAHEVAEQRRKDLVSAHEKLERTHAELQTLYEKGKELDRLKTDFFSNISHELRTPLSLILGPVRKQIQICNSDRTRRDLEVIERNAQLLLNHVNNLLDFSRLDSRRMNVDYTYVDLALLLRTCTSCFEAVAQERKIVLVTNTPEKMMAEADVDKIQRVIFNLLSNAFKFTPAGGRIFCSLGEVSGCAQFLIEDSGPGVDGALREAIFERFRQGESGLTRKHGGTGLGLAIVKEFVALHGGNVCVEDPPGAQPGPHSGACFKVILPLKAPEGAAVQAHTPPVADEFKDMTSALRADADPLDTAGPNASLFLPGTPSDAAVPPEDAPHVLVVEDNAAMNRFIVETLQGTAFVESAFNGREGLEKARRRHPDVIVSDLMMPEMSGEELLRALKAAPETADIPVLMLTAKNDDETRLRLLEEGAQDYIQKPVPANELRTRVKHLASWRRTASILQKELDSTSVNVEALTRALTSRFREAQAARKLAQDANRAKDEFLMTLSHELRTPLTPIVAWSRMLQESKYDELTRAHALQVIERNAQAQSKLIEDLLDISRIVAGKLTLNLKPVDAALLIKSSLDSSRPSIELKRQRLVTHLPPLSLLVVADSMRLQQIVWNLLANAVKFTEEGGLIEISLDQIGRWAELTVRDTGRGISPEFLPYVFERFRQQDSSVTREHGGMGLGLSIVRHLVEMHGGTIAASSPGIGGGSIFTIHLPIFLPECQEALSNDLARRMNTPLYMQSLAALNGLTAIVVEDETDTRELLRILLESYGMKVRTFESAQGALGAIQDLSADVIISDIGMPHGDGIEMMSRIRHLPPERGGRVPAIALTAYAKDDDQAQILKAGYHVHMAKPVNPQALIAAIGDLLCDERRKRSNN